MEWKWSSRNNEVKVYQDDDQTFQDIYEGGKSNWNLENVRIVILYYGKGDKSVW